MSVTVETAGADAGRRITLTKTGGAAASIDIGLVGQGAAEHFDVSSVTTDRALSTVHCVADILLVNPDITIAIAPAAGSEPPSVAITIAHVIFGGGTTRYALRTGDDKRLHAFLATAAFPVA